jgi:hypothetical protein
MIQLDFQAGSLENHLQNTLYWNFLRLGSAAENFGLPILLWNSFHHEKAEQSLDEATLTRSDLSEGQMKK